MGERQHKKASFFIVWFSCYKKYVYIISGLIIKFYVYLLFTIFILKHLHFYTFYFLKFYLQHHKNIFYFECTYNHNIKW